MEETTARWVIEFSLATVANTPVSSLPLGKFGQALLTLGAYALGGTLLGAAIGATLGVLAPETLAVAFNGAFTGLGIGGALGLPLSAGLLRG